MCTNLVLSAGESLSQLKNKKFLDLISIGLICSELLTNIIRKEKPLLLSDTLQNEESK